MQDFCWNRANGGEKLDVETRSVAAFVDVIKEEAGLIGTIARKETRSCRLFFSSSFLLALGFPSNSCAAPFCCFLILRLISRRVCPILSRHGAASVPFYLFAFTRRSRLNTVIYILSGDKMPWSVNEKRRRNRVRSVLRLARYPKHAKNGTSLLFSLYVFSVGYTASNA